MVNKKYKIRILRDLCIGAGACEVISPNVFKVDEEGKAIVLDQETKIDENGFVEVTKDVDENVLDAAKACPVFAIIFLDENSNQIWPEK